MDAASLTGRLQETLGLFEEAGPPLTTTEVAEELDLGRRSTYARLERLSDADRLETKKVGANARVWWRPSGSTPDDDSSDDGSDRQLRSLVEATEEYAIFMLDPEGHVRTWNPGAERIKGYEASEIVGEHFSTFYTEEDRANGVPDANLEAATEHGSTEDQGWRVTRDGSRFYASVTITTIRDEGGGVEGYAKVTRDMTQRRAYEQRLREEKAFTESLLETQRDVVYAIDTDGDAFRWNERLTEVTGYADEEIREMEPVDLIADDVVPRVKDAIERVFDGESVTVEAPLVTAAGEEVPYEFTGTPLRDEEGTIVGLTGVGRDVSERKATEHRLERQRDDLRRELGDVFTRIDDAFFALDDEWRFVHANEQAETLLDRSAEELVGRTIWEEFPGTIDSTFQEQYERAMETQESISFEEYYAPLESWFEVTAYPSETGLSVYFKDVTDRKARERELQRYETIVSTIEDGVYVLDEDFCFAKVNDAYVEMTGYDREELLGSHCSLVVDDEVWEESADRLEEIIADQASGGVIEADINRADGSTLRAESRFTAVPAGDGVHQKAGVVRDVSERVARERELERRVRQQEVVAELGQRAVEGRDLDDLMADAAELVADTLDNDYCKVLDLDPEAEELLLRQGVGWDEGIVGEATVSSVEDDSQAAYTLTTEGPVVVEDLTTETRFSGPELLTSHDVRSGISTIIGSREEPWGILGTHDTDEASFSEQDATFVTSVANVLASAIDRHRYEEELIYQREQIAALHNVSEVVQGITGAVIDQSTREEIEQTVCDRLAGTDSYAFAWVGDVDTATETVNLRAEAGVEGYLDGVTISVDPDDERGRGPTGRAFRTGEVQTTEDVRSDESYGPWREHSEAHDVRSSAAIPITHEDTVYSVLNVYSDRPNAFEGGEREVVSQLGEVVGHAIAAAERKKALMSDEVVELEFQIEDVFGSLGIGGGTEATIVLDRSVPLADDEFLFFGHTTEEGVDTVDALVEEVPFYEDVRYRNGGDRTDFELLVSEPPVMSVIASLGGSVERAVIEDGDYNLTVHLSPGADVRQLIDAMNEAYPGTNLLKHRQLTKQDRGRETNAHSLTSALTDRQRSALEAAYYAGFFEWPRDTSGEEVASSMDVSPATFHQHLRKAERKVFDALLSASSHRPE